MWKTMRGKMNKTATTTTTTTMKKRKKKRNKRWKMSKEKGGRRERGRVVRLVEAAGFYLYHVTVDQRSCEYIRAGPRQEASSYDNDDFYSGPSSSSLRFLPFNLIVIVLFKFVKWIVGSYLGFRLWQNPLSLLLLSFRDNDDSGSLLLHFLLFFLFIKSYCFSLHVCGVFVPDSPFCFPFRSSFIIFLEN